MGKAPAPDAKAKLDRALTEIYEDLRQIVARRLRGNNLTLRPTEVVDEAYMRLAKLHRSWSDPGHVRGVAVRAAHDVIVDYARQRCAVKRGGWQAQKTLVDGDLMVNAPTVDVLDLHAALTKLARERPKQADVVLFRFFGNMSFREIADLAGIREDTAKKYWQHSRAWLNRELSAGDRDDQT